MDLDTSFDRVSRARLALRKLGVEKLLVMVETAMYATTTILRVGQEKVKS